MIDRNDYKMLMQVMFQTLSHPDKDDECQDFGDRIERLIITSYEINNPEHGAVNVIDVTGDIIEVMGRHWAAIQGIGIQKVEFVQYKLDDLVILETGRMEGHGSKEFALDAIRSQPDTVLRLFTKGLVLAMRKYDSMILKEMTEEGDTDHRLGGDDVLDLATLVQQFLEEEIDETVAQFSSQLDAVFGVADVPPRWSEPKGVRHDDPSPF